MQNMYIERDGKEIQLTWQEIFKAHCIYHDYTKNKIINLYKTLIKEGLTEINHPEMIEDEEFLDRFAEYMYRLVTQKGCDFDWCFNTKIYGGFHECYADMVEIFSEKER